MENLFALILTAALVVLFFYFKSKKEVIKKSPASSKADIIKNYEEELLAILEECKDDYELGKRRRIDFLKKVNQELSMNIFFEKDEARKVLEELSRMECI